MSDQSSNKATYLTVAALVAIWGILGVMDQGNVPYSGFQTDGNNTVTRILPGSPAEAAGLQVGDYITSTGGIAVEDSRALARRPRPAIGETRTIVVERRADTTLGAGDEGAPTVNAELTYTQLAGRANAIGYVAALIGFCFLVFGVLPYTKAQTRNTMLLALMGISLALAFFGGPYFQSYALRTAVGSLTILAILFGFAFLMDFMMSYPQAKAWTEKNWAKYAIYGPATLVSLVILYVIIMNPTATGGLNVFVNIMFGVFVVYYFGAAMVAMFQSFSKATPAERESQGLTLMLAGVIVGLLPVTIGSLIAIFAPQAVLPGQDFYFMTLVLIPIALSMAVMKKAGPAAPAAEPPATPAM